MPFHSSNDGYWIGLALFQLSHAFRPAHFSSLITRVSHRVIRNRVERAFLLSKAKYVLIDPVFEAESEEAESWLLLV